MRSKAKLFVTIAAVFLAMVASAVAVVAVLAAQTVTIQSSNVTISYKVSDVIADVTAYYKVGSSNAITSTDGKKLGPTIEFNYANTTGSIALGGAYELNRTNHSIVFLYVFDNKANDFTATCTVTKTKLQNFEVYVTVGDSGTEKKVTLNDSTTLDVLTVTAGTASDPTTETYKIRLKIADPNANADLSLDFAWELNYKATTT